MAGGGIPTSPSPGGDRAYPGNLTLYVTFTCIVAAMGGLIFGYDIGISGNNNIYHPFFQSHTHIYTYIYIYIYIYIYEVSNTNQRIFTNIILTTDFV